MFNNTDISIKYKLPVDKLPQKLWYQMMITSVKNSLLNTQWYQIIITSVRNNSQFTLILAKKINNQDFKEYNGDRYKFTRI